jgi:long-chain acyl-CoA synthetase
VLFRSTDWLETSAPKDFSFTPVYNELATIVYTSGTTGPPKGVMLSHQNILANSYAGLQCMDVYPDDSFLSFLPLSHMLERTAGYYMPMMAGAMVSFARSIPELAEDLVTQKPTILVSVPRIFEKIHNTITSGLQTRPAPVRKLFSAAVKTGWHNFLHQQGRTDWGADLLLQPLYDLAVGRKVRERFGGRLRIIISGGAPLGIEIAKMFIGLGLPIYQGYGLTETSPVISVNRHDDNRPEGVGRPLEGLEVKIGEHEELLVCGHCVMQGYWRNEAATAAAIDQDGWLHTGDKAIIEDGRIRITGRIKEIIVLSNGEKVAPTDMEMAIAMDPLFEHCLVIGEGRPFLSMLAVLNRGLFEELAIELAIAPDSSSLDNPQLREVILKKIETLLAGFPGFVYIRDIALSLQPWTVEEGLLTPTLKLKRAAIERQMASEIQRIYSQKNRIKKTFKQGAD